MMIFNIAALMVIAWFYGIYFIKLFKQRRKGITTFQIGRGSKPRKTYIVEKVMGIATVAIVLTQLWSIELDWTMFSSPVRIIGLIIAILGDVVFLLAVMTMGDSWRAGIPEEDRTKIITTGVYGISRNPAFLAFDLMYIGILVMFFNYLLCVVSLWVILMLHLQILEEEKYLPEVFGEAYLAYKKKVRRYM